MINLNAMLAMQTAAARLALANVRMSAAAAEVIARRVALAATGRLTPAEAARMWREKIEAAADAARPFETRARANAARLRRSRR